jgi:uncharacterized DUF497 family protein
MEFEYDPNKSQTNYQKHGINFQEAQKLWDDDNRLQVEARSETEPRFALIAMYQGKLWTAFYTLREGRIRLISVKRSRQGERKLYHESA